jgi:hypothetical protein
METVRETNRAYCCGDSDVILTARRIVIGGDIGRYPRVVVHCEAVDCDPRSKIHPSGPAKIHASDDNIQGLTWLARGGQDAYHPRQQLVRDETAGKRVAVPPAVVTETSLAPREASLLTVILTVIRSGADTSNP